MDATKIKIECVQAGFKLRISSLWPLLRQFLKERTLFTNATVLYELFRLVSKHWQLQCISVKILTSAAWWLPFP